MQQVNVTELRAHLPHYLQLAKEGEEIIVISRGHDVARISPPISRSESARERLKSLRAQCIVGDVLSPLEAAWDK